jgi:hypothetical protein
MEKEQASGNIRVIFFGIDGVLTTIKSAASNKQQFSHLDWSTTCVRNLRKLVKTTEAKLVLMSSWRLNVSGLTVVNDGLEFHALPKITDVTPNHPGYLRGAEIDSWMVDHANFVESFVIIAKENDYFPYQQAAFIQTTPEKGLTLALARQAAQILCANQVTL